MQHQAQNEPIITSAHLIDLFNRFFTNTVNQESEYSNYTKEWTAFKELLAKEPVDLAQAFQFIANLQQKNELQQKQQQTLHVPEPVSINKAASEPWQRSKDHYGLGQVLDRSNLLKQDLEHHSKDLLDPYKTRKVSMDERSILKKVAIYTDKPDINELQKEIEGLRNQPGANDPSQSKHYLLH